MSLSSDFGARLKRARKEKGLSQEQVAEKIGKSRDRVIAFEKGNVTLDMAETLAEAVGTPLEMLLFPMVKNLEMDGLLFRIVGIWPSLNEDERRTIAHVAETLSRAKGIDPANKPSQTMTNNKKSGA